VKPDDLSNISYLIGGLYLLVNFTPVPGIAMILLAIGSYLAHVHGGKWWAWDWAMMYGCFSAIALHNLGLSPLLFIPFAYLGYKYGVDEYLAFAILFVVSVVSAYLAGVAIWLPLGLFAVAFAFQRYAEASGDHNSSRYQLFHSLWHVVTMPAIVLLCS
jgi:hypothetical protein